MNRIFLALFNISITASWLILAVLFLRILLKKAPKWVNCLLWAAVALRLILPFHVESALSLIPSTTTVPVEIEMMEAPTVNTGIEPIDHVINPVITERYAPVMENSVNPMQIVIWVAVIIWISGVILLLAYALFSFIRLKRKVSISNALEERVFICDEIDSPFILGVFRPVIYIPSDMEPLVYEFVLSHERAHLKRGDHFWKPFGYVLLAIYWFNPLCWVAYFTLCKDIELACDEKATRHMDRSMRADYCQALLCCSVNRSMIAACPVAFGEVGVKERVKSVLNYKKPTFWIIAVAIVACVILMVCFLTDPKEKEEEFLDKWAQAFCDRDGQTIADMSSDSVKESLEEQGLLIQGDQYISFGYSSPWPMWEEGDDVIHMDDSNMSGEILYYAWTSEPHVTVWKEDISFEEINGELVVASEELHYLDHIASGMEYDMAYPAITGTPMDYSANGFGEALIQNSLLSSSTRYFDLQDPVKAAKYLLNLLDNENKVLVERLQEDAEAEVVNLKITFMEDGVERFVSMIELDQETGIWIPQDYGIKR